MSPRILVIRGGAIGDFILTLPPVRLLRENFPCAHIEILGYKHIIGLAERSGIVDATRSIEYASLAGFFARGGTLAADLADYFGSFQQVISYLYDPDRLFETNVRKCGVRNFLGGAGKLDDSEHAALQLARPLQSLALYLDDTAASLTISKADREFAERFARGTSLPLFAVHPGSGSERKNWPVKNWAALGNLLLESFPTATVLLVGGEADRENVRVLRAAWPAKRALVAEGLPLWQLAGLLARCDFFAGHDSGISHLAAAVGTRAILLFGPTDPAVWAPSNSCVTIVQAPRGNMELLSIPDVSEQLLKAAALPS